MNGVISKEPNPFINSIKDVHINKTNTIALYSEMIAYPFVYNFNGKKYTFGSGSKDLEVKEQLDHLGIQSFYQQ